MAQLNMYSDGVETLIQALASQMKNLTDELGIIKARLDDTLIINTNDIQIRGTSNIGGHNSILSRIGTDADAQEN